MLFMETRQSLCSNNNNGNTRTGVLDQATSTSGRVSERKSLVVHQSGISVTNSYVQQCFFLFHCRSLLLFALIHCGSRNDSAVFIAWCNCKTCKMT